jgi:branched-chain amino acid transport system permease protein
MRKPLPLRLLLPGLFVLGGLILPLVAPQFWVVQIGTATLWLAMIAMSLVFLIGHCGMVSFAQVGLSGVAGYTLAILASREGLDPWLASLVALLVATAVGAFLGAVAVRTYGIYFLMITLTYGMIAYLLANQAHHITGGHNGIRGVPRPSIAGASLGDPTVLYLTAFAVLLGVWGLLSYVARTPFGLAARGVRDNPERMRALGFNVELHRIGAFTLAAFIAGLGGLFAVWYNAQISPGSIDIIRVVNVLIIAVIGGMYRLGGAVAGALLFTLLANYMILVTPRYNMIIGVIFVLVLLLSPGGLAGIWERTTAQLKAVSTRRAT